MLKLEYLVTKTQKELMAIFRKQFKREIAAYKKGKFLLIRGDFPVMLVAHLDTVHAEPVKVICKSSDGNILMSPQGIGGDDRCGVYALLSAYESARIGQKPWILFTCDEETGGHGAEEFCTWYETGKLPDAMNGLKMIIEIDRKGSNDAVYYSCDNREFEAYITGKGYETAYGSFSDISYIAPYLGVAAVNLSSGYYYAHTQHEYINRKHLDATIEAVKGMVKDAGKLDFPRYAYVEKVYIRRRISENYEAWGSTHRDWTRDDYFSVYGYDNPNAGKYPADLPIKYRQIYDELTELYDPAELDDYRAEFGNEVLQDMYDEEIMGIYDDRDAENTETPKKSAKGSDNTATKR